MAINPSENERYLSDQNRSGFVVTGHRADTRVISRQLITLLQRSDEDEAPIRSWSGKVGVGLITSVGDAA